MLQTNSKMGSFLDNQKPLELLGDRKDALLFLAIYAKLQRTYFDKEPCQTIMQGMFLLPTHSLGLL